MLKSVITFISISLLLMCTESFACELTYEVRSDDLVSELCITIEKNANGITYRSTYRDVKQLYYYKSDGSMVRWEYADSGENTDFKAERNAGDIIIRGISKGQAVNKSLEAGDRIWLQNSEFGLLDFLKANEKSKDFIVVAPEDLSIKKFRATRAPEEEITWNGQQIRAVKMTARLRGFLSLFWQSTYWHRLPEMTFVRYKADGLPGVPAVDIELVQEKIMQ